MPIFSIMRYGTECIASLIILQLDYFPAPCAVLEEASWRCPVASAEGAEWEGYGEIMGSEGASWAPPARSGTEPRPKTHFDVL